MSFIHGLLENSSKEVRERKRRLLERDYTETEEVLNVYLNEKYDEVTQILNIYRDVSEDLQKNRRAVQKMKRDIGQCKCLLSFNREELRRLWLELVEQRRSLELIEVLDRVKSAPEVLKNLIAAKAWPEATEYLLKMTEIMTKEVEHVPALDTVKAELSAKKKILTDEMRSTLFFLVFNQPIALAISDRNNRYNTGVGMQYSRPMTSHIADNLSDFCSSRRGSQLVDAVSALCGLPLSDWRSLSSDPPEVDSSLFRDPLAVAGSLLSKHLGSDSLASSKEAKNRTMHHPYGANRTRDFTDRMITDKGQWAENIVALTHCLHRLQKLSQAFSSWRRKTQNDFSGIPTSKSTQNNNEIFVPGSGLIAEIHNSITLPAVAEIERTQVLCLAFNPSSATQGETAPSSTLADPTYLVELLELLFPALCMHFNAFMLVLKTTRKIKEQNPDVSFQFSDVLSEEHIWEYIQIEVSISPHPWQLVVTFLVEFIVGCKSSLFSCLLANFVRMQVQTVLSAHLSNQKPLNNPALPMTDNRSSSASVAAVSTFNASKLDLNALMGKRKGALPAFLSGVTGDSSGSSNAHHSGLNDGFSAFNNGESFFSFSKTAHSLSLNSYLRENHISIPSASLHLTNFLVNSDSVLSINSNLSKKSYLEEQCFGRLSDDSISTKPLTMEDGGGVQGETISSYPVVCHPSAGNVKSIYSLVLAFARHIETQPVSSQGLVHRALSNDGDGTTLVTTANERRPPPAVPLRENKNTTGPTFIVQGLRGAIFAMGAQKMLPKRLTIRCQLRVFLLSFIDRLYLPNAEVELRQPIVLAVSNYFAPGPDALTSTVSQHIQRELGLQRPILSVAYLTNHALGESKGMAISLPDYAANCAKIGLSVLETFLTWASSVYKSISVSEANGTTIPSAEWARDNDLSRFWTNFPVWQRMMAADAFATVNTVHNVGNPHDPQLGIGVNNNRSTIFGDPCHPSTAGSSLSSAAAIVLGLSNLGINGRTDSTFAGGASLQAIPFANSVGQSSGVEDDQADGGGNGAAVSNGGISKQEDILLHEREATRLAVKEMDNLLHIIGDEVGSSTDFCLPTAGMLTIKSMGRLRESVHWLERCVQNWLAWLEGNVLDLDMAPFTKAAEELTSLSDATLLTVYLDVRVQAYNLFGNLPRTANFWCPVDEVDVDPEVTRCLIYWDQLQEVLIHSFCPHEIRHALEVSFFKHLFIFDGLGDFISQIFLRLIPQITRMNVNGNRKMCRNIYKLQQALALLTENHESDLIRVKQLYELFYLNPEAVVNRVIEQGVAFEVGVYQNLLRLYQRSHPSHDHSRTDDSITKLAQIIRA
ncbi:unnamed protein product [Hydatigera taeniaeformis]|uniref:Exocyst complex component Sec8 n=1 Tax=Hydatigena taeniaeformis TaxID=6205 RepID=A0A158RDX0_HYDTA|nr:unnamed protein product [Hydatigera taeniaeformis]